MEQKWIPKLGTGIIRIQTEQHYIINKVEKHFSKKEVKYHLKQEDGPVDLIVGYDELKTLFRPIKQTNADRIRSMTDEELAANMMCPAEYDLNFNKNEKCNGEMNKNCYECLLKWLRAESDYIECEKNFTILLSMIGKTVFLTREEAEAKLKEMEEKDGK